MDKVQDHTHDGVSARKNKGKNLEGAPQLPVTLPSGGMTVDAEARASLTDLITKLKAIGLLQ